MWAFTWQVQNICTCLLPSELMFRVKKNCQVFFVKDLATLVLPLANNVNSATMKRLYESFILTSSRLAGSCFFFKDKLLKIFWESKRHFWKIVFMDFVFDVYGEIVWLRCSIVLLWTISYFVGLNWWKLSRKTAAGKGTDHKIRHNGLFQEKCFEK